MTDRQNDDPGSAQATIERAKQGEEILGSRVARGEPGTKQPAHDDPRLSASKTVEKLDEIVKQFEGETYGSSLQRSQETGNLNPVKPEDRTVSRGPQVLAGAATAAGAIGAARDALVTQLESDARITADPRYERDQKVFELGQAGKLALVTPLEGKTAEEQVAEDMPRLEAAERRPAGVSPTLIQAGETEGDKPNNGLKAEQEGKTGEAAVQRTKASEQAAETQAATAGRPTNIGAPVNSQSDSVTHSHTNMSTTSESSDTRAAKPGNAPDVIK